VIKAKIGQRYRFGNSFSSTRFVCEIIGLRPSYILIKILQVMDNRSTVGQIINVSDDGSCILENNYYSYLIGQDMANY
jgi:hypothetical protein